MEKYRVDTQNWSSQEYEKLEQALTKYKTRKDWEMGEGVTEDTFVELVVSDNDFEDYKVLKSAHIAVDEERMAKSLPREEGKDFDFWAKWVETVN